MTYKGLCPGRVWPYTEHNVCILETGHKGNHEDDKGREFDHARYIKPPRIDVDWVTDEGTVVEARKFGDGQYKVYEVGGNLRSVMITFGPPDAEGYRRMLFNNYDIEREDFMAFVGMLDTVDESTRQHVRFNADMTVTDL